MGGKTTENKAMHIKKPKFSILYNFKNVNIW